MKTLKYALLIVCFVAVNATAQTKQDKKAAKTAEIMGLVKNQNFDFIAQYVLPQGGGQQYLNTTYDLVVKKDSLIAFLPYFGRGYFDIPYNSNDGGIKFTSTNYSYSVTKKKNGGFDVQIRPADLKYYQQINLFISSSGYTTASFVITNRSFISFQGYITELKKTY